MSDTKEEIALDEWFEKHRYECVTCTHYYKGFCSHHQENTEDITECDDWHERNLAQDISEQRKRMWERIKNETNRRR